MRSRTKGAGLEPNVIRGFLKIKGISQADIARELSVTDAFISQVIDRTRRTENVRKLISLKLGVPYELIWGARQEKAA